MTTHKTGTREQWLQARLELLKAEKELTHQSDELARQRQELPWVPINKGYRFDTDEGSASLADLFHGRSQLLVYHFMFGPDFADGCPSCSSIADGFNGVAVHLANHDVMLWAVSRAPLPKLKAYKSRMGWAFPWASSVGGDFNFDFCASYTEEQQREGSVEYNYRRESPLLTSGREGVEISRATPDGPGKFAAMCGTDAASSTRRIRNAEEETMCPACIGSAAVMVAGAASTGGILAACIGKFRKFFATSFGLLRKTKRSKKELL